MLSKKNIEVSVVIPCYNVDKYIIECLDSIFHQTFKKIQVIAVDNNSSDHTLSILHQYKKEHNLVILQESKKGASAARNKGLSYARGEWVQFLDADDLLLPNKINHQIDLVKQTKNSCFVAGACKMRNLKLEDTEVFISEKPSLIACFIKNLGNTCSNLWNREALLKIGGWNEKLKSSQEADLMFRLLQRGCDVVIDNAPFTIVRQRESGQITNNSIHNQVRYLELRRKMMNFISSHNPALFEEEKKIIYQHLYNVIRVLSRTDIHEAARFYRLIPNSFLPSAKTRFILYKKLLDVFGFKTIELLREKLQPSSK